MLASLCNQVYEFELYLVENPEAHYIKHTLRPILSMIEKYSVETRHACIFGSRREKTCLLVTNKVIFKLACSDTETS